MAVTVTNARTKGKMTIAEDRYAPMAAAIMEALKSGKKLPYTELLNAVKGKLRKFPGSVSWYLITVIRDLESKGKVVCRIEGKRPFYGLK